MPEAPDGGAPARPVPAVGRARVPAPPPSGGESPPDGGPGSTGPDITGSADPAAELVAAAALALREPGLVVITGAPGTGRSTLLRRLHESFRGTVHAGGGLAMLRGVPALPLARAVRVRLPVHDPALLAEAVRSRVRHGLLLIDDLQWADPLTVAALPAIAAHCRVAVTLRTPHRLPGDAEQTLRAAATAWLPAPPLPAPVAEIMVRQIAPAATAAAVADIVRRSGGVPLAITALARRAAARRDSPVTPDGDAEGSGLAYAVATALADLGRPARTAMAALGLLGRPAPAAMLGEGAAELAAAGLIEIAGTTATPMAAPMAAPVSPFVAEIAAGLLDPAERAALHRRLAGVVPPREAARHLAAAGAAQEAYTVAVEAAGTTRSSGERAELLLLACDLPGVAASAEVRLAAARAALVAGRPQACLRVLGEDALPGDPQAAVLRGEALLQTGAAAAARTAVTDVPDDADPDLVGGRDRLRLLGLLGADPAAAVAEEATIRARHGDEPAHLGLRAALAAVRAANRTPGWEYGLATAAAAAGTGGDPLAARWSAWLLVETLTADARLADAASAAATAAAACAADLAYSWQTRFLAAQLWCTALRGADLDQVSGRAGDLTDRTLPAIARGYAAAAVSLTEADGGLLASARGRLSEAGHGPAAPVVDWVAREAAWLDGQPEIASAPFTGSAGPLLDGLRLITANWAAHDTGGAFAGPGPALPVVESTVGAWAGRSAEAFTAAAGQWHDIARREEVRCLLAAGLFDDQPDRAVPALLQAEKLAEEAGLVVLLGRTRRALRRHAVRRDTRGRRAGDELTDRERDVLRLVAKGEPTRRIAGQLGISRETVETHIRAGMRKLGARTRTEAAALAMEALSLEGET